MREALAAYAHEAWAGWLKYMFREGLIVDGKLVLPPDSTKRWLRQMSTEYKDLPEDEKRSDRAEADRILDIVRGKL